MKTGKMKKSRAVLELRNAEDLTIAELINQFEDADFFCKLDNKLLIAYTINYLTLDQLIKLRTTS